MIKKNLLLLSLGLSCFWVSCAEVHSEQKVGRRYAKREFSILIGKHRFEKIRNALRKQSPNLTISSRDLPVGLNLEIPPLSYLAGAKERTVTLAKLNEICSKQQVHCLLQKRELHFFGNTPRTVIPVGTKNHARSGVYTNPLEINGEMLVQGSKPFFFADAEINGSLTLQNKSKCSFKNIDLRGSLKVSSSGTTNFGNVHVGKNATLTLEGLSSISFGHVLVKGNLILDGDNDYIFDDLQMDGGNLQINQGSVLIKNKKPSSKN